MKKTLFTLVALISIMAANAQQTWDFTHTPDADSTALAAATSEWTATTSGTINRFESKNAIEGAIKAGGKELSMTKGITISGGEPFLQASALVNLLQIVHETRPDLTVMSYTGYTKESLIWPDAQNLIKYLDLLIDGPYVQALNDNKGVRGSSNQRLHFFTSRLLPWKEELENGKRKVEYHITNGNIKAYGVPTEKMYIK